jgi:CRP-like cAMP-binding protein
MKKAIDILNKIKPLDEGLIGRLTMSLQLVEVKKNAYLFRGFRCLQDIYIIGSGLLGICYKERHYIILTGFRAAGDVIIHNRYFYGDTRVHGPILALGDSTIYSLSYPKCKQICHDFPEFNYHVRVLLQKNIDILEDRAIITQISPIRRRYERFAITYAELFHRIPIKYLASYLNASVKSIQRVRREISARGGVPPIKN